MLSWRIRCLNLRAGWWGEVVLFLLEMRGSHIILLQRVWLSPGYSAGNSPAISIRGGEPWLMSYCWRIYFKVLGVLFLAHVSHAFWPSKKACGIRQFRHF